MNKYFAFWKRGWWAFLHMICADLALVAVSIPFIAMKHKPAESDWGLFIVIWLLVGAPVWGWVFELFATKSKRLMSED